MPIKERPQDFIDASDTIAHALLKLRVFVTLLQGNGNKTPLDLTGDDVSGICLFMDESVEDIEASNELMFEFYKQGGKQ